VRGRVTRAWQRNCMCALASWQCASVGVEYSAPRLHDGRGIEQHIAAGSAPEVQGLYGDTLPWPLNYFIPYGQAVAAKRRFKDRHPEQVRSRSNIAAAAGPVPRSSAPDPSAIVSPCFSHLRAEQPRPQLCGMLSPASLGCLSALTLSSLAPLPRPTRYSIAS
jgi:hypothetical protein